MEKSDYYLCRDDPYSVVRGECTSVHIRRNIPEEATHYSLGPKIQSESVSYGKNKYGSSIDHVPIVFLKKSD